MFSLGKGEQRFMSLLKFGELAELSFGDVYNFYQNGLFVMVERNGGKVIDLELSVAKQRQIHQAHKHAELVKKLFG